jgi:GT2 family glycosyltransferase
MECPTLKSSRTRRNPADKKQTAMPTTTAIIVTYNSAKTVHAALDTLRRAHNDGLLSKVIVVDNVSADGTADLVTRDHPWVTLLRSPSNLGYGRGLNLGLRHVDTPYVLFMNPDSELPPEALVKLVTFMESHPNAGMCAPAMLFGDGEQKTFQAAGALPGPLDVVLRGAGFVGNHRNRRPIVPDEPPFRTDWLCGAMMLTRTALMREIGAFDPRYFLYFEETDLCRRVLDHGRELWAVGEAVTTHVGGASAKGTDRPLYNGCISEHFFRSRYYYLAKHHGRLPAIFAELGEVMALAAACVLRPKRERFLRLSNRLKSPILRMPDPWREPVMVQATTPATEDSVRQHTVGVVVIGRNEGERLPRCLRSVIGTAAAAVVYVDSGSSDDSVDAARDLGADVVQLDTTRPFSAARARNEGFRRLLDLRPDVRFVQFVDGDCEVVAGWLRAAADALATQPDLAAVCGRLRERYPERSIYNRLCDLEWNTPIGDVKACGGIAMYRVGDFNAVGGFDPTVTAGEEPELCLRLRKLGKRIHRLDAEMALHDAAMLRFSQWWRRQVRGGYGGLDVATRFEADHAGTFTRQVGSARVWTAGWTAALVVATAAAWAAGGPRAATLAAIVVSGILPLQMVRIALNARRKGAGIGPSITHGTLTMLGKWAQLQGQMKYRRDRTIGRGARLIEHRDAPVAGRAPALAAPAVAAEVSK